MKRVIAAALLVAAAVLAVAVGTQARARGRYTIPLVRRSRSSNTRRPRCRHQRRPQQRRRRQHSHVRERCLRRGRHAQGRYRPGIRIRIVVGSSWQCTWTTFLPSGQITVEGPFSDTGNTVLAITGGTGAYRNACWRDGVLQLPQSARDEVRLRLSRDRLSVTGASGSPMGTAAPAPPEFRRVPRDLGLSRSSAAFHAKQRCCFSRPKRHSGLLRQPGGLRGPPSRSGTPSPVRSCRR